MSESILEGTRRKIRFNTNKGLASIEQLWDMPMTHPANTSMDSLYKDLNKKRQAQAGESLIVAPAAKDSAIELQFAIVKEITLIRLAEIKKKENQLADKAHNAKIDKFITNAEEKEMGSKSVSELLAMKK